MKQLVWIFSLSFLLVSCGDSQESLNKEIEGLTEIMKNENYPSKENMEKIVILFDRYIEEFPEAKESYSYMELKAKYQAANNNYEQALITYEDLVKRYPEDNRSADAVFMQAFIIENYLLDKVKAKTKYSDFLKHYPNHELADDAQFSIENLSLTDEEIMKKLQSFQTDSSNINLQN